MKPQSERNDLKHGSLVQSVFMYVASALKEGDGRTMRRLGLRADQTERLSRMTATDLVRLGELGNQCVTLDINGEALDRVFRAIDERREHDELVERCMRRDAPRAMMQEFFGISRHRYSRLRTAIGMAPRRGRHARVFETLDREIYALWLRGGERWTAGSLLDIADTLNVSLRAVWSHLTRYRA